MSLYTYQQSLLRSIVEQAIPTTSNKHETNDDDKRLQVYHTNYIGTLLNTLQQTYPAIYQILGEDCFNHIAKQHIQSHPLQSEDLNHYGHGFHTTLTKVIDAQANFEDYPYLPDLAQLEWQVNLAYYSPEITIDFDFDYFETLAQTPEALLFTLLPSLYVFHSDYPTLALWEHNTQQKVHDTFEVSDTEFYAIHTVHTEVTVTSIDAATFQLLSLIQSRHTLDTIASYPEAIAQLAACIQQGWIIHCQQTGT